MIRLLLLSATLLLFGFQSYCQHLKEFNIYGQIGILRYTNLGAATFQRSPAFSAGINKLLFVGKHADGLYFITTGIEYANVNNYVDLHYYNGMLETQQIHHIQVNRIVNNQIALPVTFSYGMKLDNSQLRVSGGFWAAYIWGLKEDYTDSLVDKQIAIPQGYNRGNMGLECSIGLDRLYEKTTQFAALSGAAVGSKFSFFGISKNNRCIPIEFFVRINFF